MPYEIPGAFIIPDDQLCELAYWNANEALMGNVSPARLAANILQLLNRIKELEGQLETINKMIGRPITDEPTMTATKYPPDAPEEEASDAG